MKSEMELKKWLEALDKAYDAGVSDNMSEEEYIAERTRLEIQIETLQKVLDIDNGTFEGFEDG